MSKLPVDELLRRACVYAEQDQEAFIQAHEHMMDDQAVKEAVEFLGQLHAYRLKRWGRTAGDVLFDDAIEKMFS